MPSTISWRCFELSKTEIFNMTVAPYTRDIRQELCQTCRAVSLCIFRVKMRQVGRQLNVAKLKMVKVVKVWKLCGGLYKNVQTRQSRVLPLLSAELSHSREKG
jgi:hypothetical protein